ncbi:MAG TPA: glycosyltransferase family 39 protein [bacterium]|jgi:hypothetical protein|nr:glycosyltransferase family 39 protein [bacterium]
MKRRGRASSSRVRPQGADRLAWAAYAVGFLCFAAGLELLITGHAGPGAALSVVGILAVSLGYLAPMIPWSAWSQGLRAAVKSGRSAGGAGAKGLSRLAVGAPEGLLAFLGDGDSLSISRLFLLAPVILFLVASAVLSLGSTVQGAGAFAVAVMILAVYFQDMTQPLELDHLRQNTLAVLAQIPALPFQCLGVWLLDTRYDSAAMVWLGFFICAGASAWMYFALQRWPLDLSLEGAPEPGLDWTPPKPFYSLSRISLITGLAAASAIAACLAVYVFPGDHSGLSVAAGFLAMLLLLGSFPWIPTGLAFLPRVRPAQAATLALAAALLAFGLAAHGQDLIEAGGISEGLWFFLAGGTVLVLCLSRFAADPGRAEAREAGAWPRLEVAAVLLLVALSFAFRIWKINSFPFGVEGDEGGGGLWAMDVLKGNVENHFINQNYPLAFFSITALFFKLGGLSLATLRLHSVVFGTLSIFTAYFFLRLNMGRVAAFLTTLLMSFSYWHLHFSRFGHYNIEQVAVQMAAFYFVFKALRTGLLWQWAVAGVSFGLAMFPHMAGRILPFEGLVLVVYFFLARRDLLRRHLPGFLAFVVLAWAVASPAVVYWRRAQSVSMSRINEVSIFDKNNTNAPIDTLQGFVSNCRSSMLMFNYQGDNRARDNPVAPDKILEHWTAILFGLALLYVLYHWREPVNFFLLGVFFLNLCASVFSVEAPQTLRTAGNIPIVFAFMAVPIADLAAALRGAGRAWVRTAFVGLLIAFSFFSYRSARRLFVDARDLSFDASPTYIARTAGLEGGPDTQAVFWGTGFAASHPPMLLFKMDTPLRNFYGPFEYLPVTTATTHDHLLFLSDSYQQIMPYLQWLYPGAAMRPVPDQQGRPLALYLRVNKGMIAAGEGLDGSARVGGRTVPVKGMPPVWPSPGLEQAREINVGGSLSVDSFGTYGLEVSGVGDARVSVDGKLLFSRRSGSLERHAALLAKGLHTLSLRLDPARGDAMRLLLNAEKAGPSGVPWSLSVLGLSPVDKTHTLRIQPSGFFGRYFESITPQGDPVFEVVEPIVMDHWLDPPLLGNWSARWHARFKVDAAGYYRFSVAGGNYSQVRVDTKLVWKQGQLDGVNEPGLPQPSIHLSPGWHDYEAEFCTTGGPGYELDWTKPDGSNGVFWVPDMRPLP